MLRQALLGHTAPITLSAPLDGWEVRIGAGGKVEALYGHIIAAHLAIEEHPNGVFIVTNLEGDGDPYAIQLLAATLRGIFSPGGFFLGVHCDNPKYEQLMKAYKRIMGATKTMMLMHVAGDD